MKHQPLAAQPTHLTHATTGWAHRFDSDAVCTVCGFDGAEWASQYREPGEKRLKPLCTKPGLSMDTYEDQEDDGYAMGDPDEYSEDF